MAFSNLIAYFIILTVAATPRRSKHLALGEYCPTTVVCTGCGSVVN
jgi:hypothetical protein